MDTFIRKQMKHKSKFIAIVLSLFILSGCVTSKKCYRKFPPQIKTETITKEVTVFRDTIIYIELPADTSNTTDFIEIECPEYDSATHIVKPFKYDIDTLRAETGLAIGYTWITPKGIRLQRHLMVVDKDTTIMVQLENAIRERDRLEQVLKTEIHIPEPVKYVPFWSKLLWLLIGMPIGYFGVVIYKKLR